MTAVLSEPASGVGLSRPAASTGIGCRGARHKLRWRGLGQARVAGLAGTGAGRGGEGVDGGHHDSVVGLVDCYPRNSGKGQSS
ncbi:MAG: hypothetical protein M3N28_11520 [Actinomycetota bacterium]|nr:hypothetical protein [Actinomycetota bacterium]